VDTVLLTLDPVAAGEVVVALRKMGWGGVVAGGPALGSPLFAQVAGDAAAEVVFVAPYRWPQIEGEDVEFSAAYQSLGPHVPHPGPFALTTYDAVQGLLAAIESSVGHGETLGREALAAAISYPSETTGYLFRWTSSGVLELISETSGE
jgi:ABC-type branched-subunit amino acid transport system substrate-binding protein